MIKRERLYAVWSGMRYRCSNPNHTGYHRYGGRGIRVCDEWNSSSEAFIGWALANGYQLGLTIDRIDNDGNYEPSNCRWVSHRENCRNRVYKKSVASVPAVGKFIKYKVMSHSLPMETLLQIERLKSASCRTNSAVVVEAVRRMYEDRKGGKRKMKRAVNHAEEIIGKQFTEVFESYDWQGAWPAVDVESGEVKAVLDGEDIPANAECLLWTGVEFVAQSEREVEQFGFDAVDYHTY